MKIAVAGTGYVGLSLATLLSQKNEVFALDVIPEKVEKINNRISPIQDEYIEKYFEEKDYGKTPQIFDFYNKEMTEIKTCMALKAALWSQQYVIIHIGLQTFPLSQMNFWGDGKVILIAHTPCENLYLKNMDYVVFNDLVNQKRCTEELLKTYVPELLYGNRDCQDILISRINEKTGGIPLAVYRLGNAIFEKELLRYEGNLEKFFALPLYLNPELESVYEDMWKDFMEDTWNKVSTDTQILLGCASYFTGDISLDLLKCLLAVSYTHLTLPTKLEV